MIKKIFRKFNRNGCKNKDKQLVSSLVKEGNEHLSELKRIDQEIMAVQRSTRTSFSFFSPTHNYLRTKYTWYYDWHTKPYATKIHVGMLVLVMLVSLSTSLLSIGSSPKPTTAGNSSTYTCTYTSGGGNNLWSNAANWSDCVDGYDNYPGSNSSAKFYTVTIPEGRNVTLDVDGLNLDATGGINGSLQISPGASLTMGDNSLTTSEVIVYNSTLTMGAGTLNTFRLYVDSGGNFNGGTGILNIGAGGAGELIINSDSTFIAGSEVNFNDSASPPIVIADNDGGTVDWSNSTLGLAIPYTNFTLPAGNYHNVNLEGDTSTYEFVPSTTISGNLTIDANATLNSTSNLTIAGNLTINAGGTLTANASIISIAGSWNSSAGNFNRGTSTVSLIGTGKFTPATGSSFYNLNLAANNKKTTFENNRYIDIENVLTLGSGTLGGQSSGGFNLKKSNAAPFINNDATITGGTNFRYTGENQIIASATYPTLYIWGTGTATLNGNITSNLFLGIYASGGGLVTLDSNNYNITAQNIGLGVNGTTTKNGKLKLGNGSLTATGNLTIYPQSGPNHNTLDLSAGTHFIGGNFINNDTLIAGTSTVNFTNASDTQTLDSGGTENIKAFHNLTHSGAGTLQLANNDIKITGNFLNSSGTFTTLDSTDNTTSRNVIVSGNFTINSSSTVSANASTITVGGNWGRSGTFQAGTSTVNLLGTGGFSGNFYNLMAAADGHKVSGGVVQISNTLTLGSGTYQASTTYLDGGDTPLITAGATLLGNMMYSSNKAGQINVAATNYSTLGISGTNNTFVADGNISAQGFFMSGQTNNNRSTFDTAGYNFTVNNNLTIGGSGATRKATFRAAGSGSITVGGNITNNSGETSGQNIIDLSNYSGTMSVGGNFTNNDTLIAGTSTVNFTNASDTQTLDSGGTENIKAFHNLTHSGAGTLQLANNSLKIDGSFLNSNGVFDAADLDLSIAKDFNISGGSFKTKATGNPTTQTVFLRSTEKTILSGSNIFNNLTIDTLADGPKTVNFASGSIQIITGDLTLSGSKDKVLTLNREGGSNDDTWELTLSDNYTSGDFISVSNSLVTPPYKIKPGANVVNGGNNSGWIFNQNPNVPSLTTPLAGAWINTATPAFVFSLSDPDNPNKAQKLKYQIQISPQFNFSNITTDYTSALNNEGDFVFNVGQAAGGGIYNDGHGQEGQALSQGQYYWRVKAIDEIGGSSSYSAGRNFTIDMSVPSITFASNPASPNGNDAWYKTAPTITVNASSPSSPVESTYYRWDSSDNFSPYSAALTAPEGVHTLYAYAVNQAGNSSQSSPTSIQYKVDTARPAVDIYANPSSPSGNNAWYKGSSPAISFTAYDPTSGAGDIYYKWDDGQYTIYSEPITALEGIHTISYYNVDIAGNQSPAFDRQYKVDTSSPTVVLSNSISPNTTIGWYKDTAPPVTLNASDTGSGAANIKYRFGTTGDYVDYSSALTPAEGLNTLYYYALDNAGNASAVTSATYQIDSSAPNTSSVTPSTTTPINKLDIPFVWSDASDGNGSGIDHYLVDIGSSAGASNLANGVLAPANNFKFAFADDGTYYIRVKAVDRVGHTSDYSTEGNVTIDRTQPVLTLSGLSDGQFVTSKEISLTGTTTKPVTGINKVRVTIDDKDQFDAGTSNNWDNWTLNWKGYADGIHTILAQAVGNAGSIASTKFSIVVDTTAPTVPADLRVFNVSNGNANAYAVYLDFAGSVDDTSKIKIYELYRNGTKLSDIGAAKEVGNANFTGNQNQPYFFVDSNLSAQKYSYKVRAVDNAGNTAETSEIAINTTGDAIEANSISELKGNPSSVVTKDKTSAIITWKTVYPATSLVEYGETTSYGKKAELDESLNQGHNVLLKDLRPGTLYHMKVMSRDIYGRNLESGDATFTTGVAPEELSAIQLIVQTLQNLFKALTSSKAAAADNSGSVMGETLEALQGFSNNLLLTDISFKEKNLYQNILAFPKGSKVEKGTNENNLSAIDSKGNSFILDQNLSPSTSYYYSLDGGTPITRKPSVGDDSPLKITDNSIVEESVLSTKDKVQITVQWKTNRGAGSSVEFGPTTAYGQKTKEDTSLNMGHNMTLESLSPDTTYHFRVSSKDASGNLAVSDDFVYTTPSAETAKTPLDIIIESLKRVLSIFNALRI